MLQIAFWKETIASATAELLEMRTQTLIESVKERCIVQPIAIHSLVEMSGIIARGAKVRTAFLQPLNDSTVSVAQDSDRVKRMLLLSHRRPDCGHIAACEGQESRKRLLEADLHTTIELSKGVNKFFCHQNNRPIVRVNNILLHCIVKAINAGSRFIE